MACTCVVRSDVIFASFLPLVCFILDHLLCPACGMGVFENARQHCEHIEERIGRRNLKSLRVDAIGNGEAVGTRKAIDLWLYTV